jgi:hypothetical protein
LNHGPHNGVGKPIKKIL